MSEPWNFLRLGFSCCGPWQEPCLDLFRRRESLSFIWSLSTGCSGIYFCVSVVDCKTLVVALVVFPVVAPVEKSLMFDLFLLV